jgi:phosphoribosyl 1,2-cyclic phosphodiesterase
MIVETLSSGSSGNCTLVAEGNSRVLIDAGISYRKVMQGLSELGLSVSDIDAVLMTHEHKDHVKGLGVLERKRCIPVYGTAGTIAAVKADSSLGKMPEDIFCPVEADISFTLGELTFRPFGIDHDAAEPVAYRIEAGGRKAAVATDLGTYSDYTVRNLSGLDAILLEANHDIRMLEAGPYPFQLKQRIRSDRGHLSNEAAGELLAKIAHEGLKKAMLGHLSKENNMAELAALTVRQTLESMAPECSAIRLAVAPREKLSVVMEI